jgi:hypothetical protein
VEGVLKCEMHLHITERPTNTEFRVRCILAIRRELSDTCHIVARWALMNICLEYEAEINNTHAKFFLVMDHTSLV